MADDMTGAEKACHVVTYEIATCMLVRVRLCARVYTFVCVCTCMHACVQLRRKHHVKDFSNSLITHTLYTHTFCLISTMWGYVFVFHIRR